jgi:peptidyl-prolyl cis-trans isomerase SurA
MNKINFLAMILALTIFNTSHSLEDKIIAIVNDDVVLRSELNGQLSTINMQGISRLESAKLKKDILDQLIEESLLEQAANRLGIFISDIDLQKQLRAIAKNKNITVLQLKESVESQNIDYLRYLKNLRRKMQIQELFRTQFTSRAYISEEEIESYLKNNAHSKDINNIVSIREYLIEDENDELDFSKVNILFRSIKSNGIEDTKNKYPNLKINITDLNKSLYKNLPDIYQNNLKLLNHNNYSQLFKTGRGYVFLKVINGSMFSEEYKVSHILMRTNPMENLKSLKDKFYDIKRKAMDQNNFAEYAQRYSEDKASAINGGSLGWIEKQLVVPEFRNIMININIGEISEPFKTQYGWHILYLEDKRMKNISDNVLKNQAMSILRERKVTVAKREWLSKLKDQAYIEIVNE